MNLPPQRAIDFAVEGRTSLTSDDCYVHVTSAQIAQARIKLISDPNFSFSAIQVDKLGRDRAAFYRAFGSLLVGVYSYLNEQRIRINYDSRKEFKDITTALGFKSSEKNHSK